MVAIRKCDFKPFCGEYNDKKKFGYFTETIGYVPIKRQVETFFQATGGQFFTGKDEEYDFVGEAAENPQDSPFFDDREKDLSEIGAMMANLPEAKTLESTESDAKTSEVIVGDAASSEPIEAAPDKT